GEKSGRSVTIPKRCSGGRVNLVSEFVAGDLGAAVGERRSCVAAGASPSSVAAIAPKPRQSAPRRTPILSWEDSRADMSSAAHMRIAINIELHIDSVAIVRVAPATERHWPHLKGDVIEEEQWRLRLEIMEDREQASRRRRNLTANGNTLQLPAGLGR